MTSRREIVLEAREWVGTPHIWQASQKGRGCDCKGLIAGVARQLGRPEAQSLYAREAAYSHKVDCAHLRAGLEELFDRADQIGDGDLVLLRMSGKPQHLAIADLERDQLIHTYGAGPECVTATSMAAALRLWPLDSVWHWRGVE